MLLGRVPIAVCSQLQTIGPIISITIVTPIEVVVAVVIPILDIMTLAVIITIVLTLVSLAMAPIILIGALGDRSKIPYLIIQCIGVLLIVIFMIWWWWFRQLPHRIYLFRTPINMFQYQPKLSSHLRHLLRKIICD